MALIKDKIKNYTHRELLENPKIQAMLKTIRYAEGTDKEDGYGTRVGGSKFIDFSKKPRQKVYIKSINDYSSAEGAYQILDKTWDGVSKKLGLNDFSPESQDIAAVDLIIQRGALQDILEDNFEGAVYKLSSEWASLPKTNGQSTYKNQKARSLDNLKKVFYNQEKQNVLKEKITPDLINLQIPTSNGNFTEIPNLEEKEEEVYYARKSINQKQSEEDFFNNYLNFQEISADNKTSEENYIEELPQENNYDVLSAYNEAERLVEMRYGGEKNSLWRNIRNNRGSGKQPTKEMLEQEIKIKKQQEGGTISDYFIKDNRGQLAYPGQLTEIASPNITMKDIKYPILGISKETGESKMMYPEQNYFFKDTENVLEIPQLQKYLK
jgi:muramidase (phage lysozyme)